MTGNGTFHLDVGEGLHVKLLELNDAPALFALIESDRKEIRDWAPWADKTTKVDDTIAFITNALEQHRNCTGLHAGIWQDNEIVGGIGYVHMDVNNRRVMIGYWLASPYRGKGLVT